MHLLAGVALATDFFDALYGQPKAIHETYSCCVYRGNTEEDILCVEGDDECKQDYKARVQVYLVISFCIFAIWVLFCTVQCVKARRAELKRFEKTKKSPMPPPNRKDFDPICREQGDSQSTRKPNKAIEAAGGAAAALGKNLLLNGILKASPTLSPDQARTHGNSSGLDIFMNPGAISSGQQQKAHQELKSQERLIDDVDDQQLSSQFVRKIPMPGSSTSQQQSYTSPEQVPLRPPKSNLLGGLQVSLASAFMKPQSQQSQQQAQGNFQKGLPQTSFSGTSNAQLIGIREEGVANGQFDNRLVSVAGTSVAAETEMQRIFTTDPSEQDHQNKQGGVTALENNTLQGVQQLVRLKGEKGDNHNDSFNDEDEISEMKPNKQQQQQQAHSERDISFGKNSSLKPKRTHPNSGSKKHSPSTGVSAPIVPPATSTFVASKLLLPSKLGSGGAGGGGASDRFQAKTRQDSTTAKSATKDNLQEAARIFAIRRNTEAKPNGTSTLITNSSLDSLHMMNDQSSQQQHEESKLKIPHQQSETDLPLSSETASHQDNRRQGANKAMATQNFIQPSPGRTGNTNATNSGTAGASGGDGGGGGLSTLRQLIMQQRQLKQQQQEQEAQSSLLKQSEGRSLNRGTNNSKQI